MSGVVVSNYTARQQYVLGWLACDGHLDTRGGVRLQLQERDLSVLLLFVDTFRANLEPAVREVRGFRYRRAGVCSGPLHDQLVALFRGRLKREKQFPVEATTEFVLGCLDADGSFCFGESKRMTASFQHESWSFGEGLRLWLESRGIRTRRRVDRKCFDIERRGCRSLLLLYRTVPFALARKREKLETTLLFSPRWWTTEEVERLRKLSDKPCVELAAIFGVSVKAIHAKLWKLSNGYNRRDAVPAY